MSSASSLARRIVVAATLSTALAVAVAGAAMWLGTRTVLVRNLDQELAERAERFTQRGGWMLRSDRAWRRFTPPEFRAEGGSWFMQSVDAADGRELVRSPSLAPGDSLAALAGPNPGRALSARLGERPVRLLSLAVAAPAPPAAGEPRPEGAAQRPEGGVPPANGEPRPPEGPPPAAAVLHLASDLTPIEGQLRTLSGVLVGTWIVATALAAAASLWLSRTVLRPVRELSQAITSAEPTRPGARIDLAGAPRELEPLVERLNGLFARVESAFQRERTTIADIAHELRTPVTVLRTSLEFSLVREHQPHSREVLERCLRTAVHLQGLIASLLLLARLEAGQEPVHLAATDAAETLRGAWELLRERAAARGQSMDWRVPATLPVRTAEDKLRIIVANLLDNAVSHGSEGGAIAVAAGLAEGRLRITVANPTAGPAIDAESVFRPFWRADAARTGTSHSGLGLALGRRVAGVLGGTLVATSEPGRFTVVLDLPAAPAQS